MVGSFLAPNDQFWFFFVEWIIKNPVFYGYSFCPRLLRQLMLLFWKLINEIQTGKTLEPTRHHNSRKLMILLPVRAIYFRSLHYETPCIKGLSFIILQNRKKHLSKCIFFLLLQCRERKNPQFSLSFNVTFRLIFQIYLSKI